MSQKNYGLASQRVLYHFKVEEQKDYGPAVLIKFGADELSLLEDLQDLISSKIDEMKAELRLAFQRRSKTCKRKSLFSSCRIFESAHLTYLTLIG